MVDLAKTELEELANSATENDAALHEALTPKDPNDDRDIVMEIRAAAGGDEASLFGADLYRMYVRWAERHNFKVELIDESPSEVGGFKEIIFGIRGEDIYKQLKFEAGVHRVQRVPSTESQGRIHTSTVTVAVLPEAEETDIEINPSDLRIDVYRASGHGGQSVNTTDSAVRITHMPTGIVVACQAERSQHKNRDKAMKMLKAKLYEMELLKRNAEKDALEATKSDIGWGSQIRNYVLDQSRIKDLRTGIERTDTQKVLDGDLDEFVEASLKSGLEAGAKRVDA